MSKKVYVKENNLIKIKDAMASENTSHSTFMSEDKPPYEKDEFEIGGEGSNNDFFHINESTHADLDYIDSISYYVEIDDEGNEYYDGEVYDTDGHHLDYFSGDKEDIEYYFQDNLYIAEKIINKEGDKRGNEYWIENIQYDFVNDMNVNINNVDEVNKAAKRLSCGGESLFILTDGTIIGFYDHSQIQSVCNGMTISKFISLGNIRCRGGKDVYIQLIKRPTFEQQNSLKELMTNSEYVIVDFDSMDDGEHSNLVHSVRYRFPNPKRVVNDIMNYFWEGIKPISENIESEVEANQVKLDSFKKRDELVPKIWDGDKLNSRVRLKLLDIADDFWESTNIGWVKPKNIVLMGSICNYNWSKFSDIDLHLQVDFSEVDNKKDFVQEYFNGKKNEWNKEHSDLKIFDFPVELYVEDLGANTNSGGIYDLEQNDWIKKPSKEAIKPIGLNKYSIKDKAAKIMTDIDDLYDAFKNTDDDAKLRKIGEKAHKILDYVKSMRKKGLDRGGESDSGNIIYKVLRRTGYMDILWKLSSKLYDKLNSINEIAERYIKAVLNEEVVADGNADHNPFKQRWKHEREVLINYLLNYGELMTSKENGKQYRVLFDDMLSNRIGMNYCLCIQWNPLTMEPGNVIYVRAYDKFTKKIFKPEFDTRGFDNMAGTADDVITA